MSDETNQYYIFSATHTQKHEDFLTWWGPNHCGYTWYKERMGVYSEKEANKIASTCQDNYAIPKYLVDQHFVMSRDCDRVVYGIPAITSILKIFGFKANRKARNYGAYIFPLKTTASK